VNLRALAIFLAILAPGAAFAQQPTPETPSQAPAPAPSVHIEVLVLEASMGAGGVAPSLANLPQLRQPPFSAYSQITVVSRSVLPLSSTPSTTALPNNSTAGVVLTRRTPDGRYAVGVTFTQGGHVSRVEFVAGAGEPFFTVRSSRPERALILGFVIRP
jgi:hypothetical protein